MKRKILLTATILIFLIPVGFIFNFVFFKSGINSGLEQLTANATALYEQSQTNTTGFPIRLKIPEINVDATIEYVGLTQNGGIGVPKGPINVAWFKLGPKPGEKGVAVIDGHSGWKDGIPAVFDNLYKLRKGDKIYVENKEGNTVTFVVNEIKEFNPKADASSVFISNDGLSHLNLITCGGSWDEVNKTHTARLVVFADKE